MDVIPLEYVGRLVAAIACGGIIGLERELHDKPVGLRSNILICLGAAVFTLMSVVLTGGERGDPSRVAGQLVTGIGFLGAGAILRQGERILGITTAATIWLVASLGLAAGAGAYAIAAAGTALGLAVLVGFRHFETWVESLYDARTYTVAFEPGPAADGFGKVEALVREHGLRLSRHHFEIDAGRPRHVFRLAGKSAAHDAIEEALAALPGVHELRAL